MVFVSRDGRRKRRRTRRMRLGIGRLELEVAARWARAIWDRLGRVGWQVKLGEIGTRRGGLGLWWFVGG